MTLTVEIITPERVVRQMQADAVVVPAMEGELGILPQHAPLVAQLKPGEIRLRQGDTVEILAVSGGFVEVQKNVVKLFAESAEMAGEIDAERARQAALRAKEALKVSRQEAEFLQAETALQRALARLRAAEDIRRKNRPPGPPRS